MNALNIPLFRNYLAANTFSYLGNWIERLSLSWITWETSHSAFWTGVVAVGHIIPAAFLGPLFGALAERWELRRAIIVINSILSIFSILLFGVVMIFQPPVQLLAAAALLIGVVSSLSHPVRLVVISQMVPAAALSSAARHNATSYNLSRVLGPAIAGVLIATFGADWSLAANPVTFVPLLAVLYGMKLAPRDRGNHTDSSVMRSILQGISYIRRDNIIAWCMAMTASNALLSRGVLEIIPVIVGQLLHGNSILLATISSVSGSGAILASILASALVPSHANAKRLTCLAAIGGGLAIVLIGIWPQVEMAVVAIGIASFCGTMSAINSQTLVYAFADSAYRARSLTWWSTFSLGASATGGVMLSALAEVSSLAGALIGVGAAAACVGLALYLLRPATRPAN
jgi:predicted MFS family arabinose efflux permease